MPLNLNDLILLYALLGIYNYLSFLNTAYLCAIKKT